MEYVTITKRTYDEALKEAEKRYGDNFRVLSRKQLNNGLLKRMQTEVSIVIFNSEEALSSEKIENEEILKRFEIEAQTPPPEVSFAISPSNDESVYNDIDDNLKESFLQENYKGDIELEKVNTYADITKNILQMNDFSPEFITYITDIITKELEKSEIFDIKRIRLEEMIVEKIIASVKIDVESQIKIPRIVNIVGPSGAGKTTTIAKMAAIYATIPPEGYKKNTAIITLDAKRAGHFEQIDSYGKLMNIEVAKADNEFDLNNLIRNFSDKDLILIDSSGFSQNEAEEVNYFKKMYGVLSNFEVTTYLTIPSFMKYEDIMTVISNFRECNTKGLIFTKLDETKTIGNIVSASWKSNIPLFYMTNGQKLMQNIYKTSTQFVLSKLVCFNMNFGGLWDSP